MLKKSNYNIEVETLENGNKLIFNTRTSIFGIMDSNSEKIYNNIHNIDISCISDDEEKQNIHTMLQAGYIIKDDTNELDMLKVASLQQRFSKGALALTIAPTMDCNMACPYCFEKKNKKFMSQEIQESLYKFTKNYIKNNNCKLLTVIWYGGEPLLQKETIYNLSKKFIDLTNELDVNYNATIITNGVLLDRDCAKRLAEECKIKNTQITIDGLPDIHNKRRILVDGSDSFNIIINNIENCKDLLKISIRINVDAENMNSISELFNFFVNEKKWIKNPTFSLAPVEDFNNGFIHELNSNEFASLDLKNYEKLYQIQPKAIVPNLYPKPRGNFCGASNDSFFVVDPDGYLYRCWNEVGRIEQSFGNINTGIGMNNENTKWMLLMTHDKCEECKFLPICSGGCPSRYFTNKEPFCPHFIYNVIEKLKIVYSDYIIQKNRTGERVENI